MEQIAQAIIKLAVILVAVTVAACLIFALCVEAIVKAIKERKP